MSATPQTYVEQRIEQFLTRKVKEAFPEDYKLIEPVLPEFIRRYSLRELMLAVCIEINRLKTQAGRDPFTQ